MNLEIEVLLVALALQDREAVMDDLDPQATRDLQVQKELQDKLDLLDSQVKSAFQGIVDQTVAVE